MKHKILLCNVTKLLLLAHGHKLHGLTLWYHNFEVQVMAVVHYISLGNSLNLYVGHLKLVDITDFVNKPFCPDVHNIDLNNNKH